MEAIYARIFNRSPNNESGFSLTAECQTNPQVIDNLKKRKEL